MSRLLEQVRDADRTRHYSLRTEEAYIRWVREYILLMECVRLRVKDGDARGPQEFLNHPQ